jgi:hypothetical protein
MSSSLGEVGDELSISGGNGESHHDDVVVDKVIDGLTSSWFELDRSISEVLDAVFVNFIFNHSCQIFFDGCQLPLALTQEQLDIEFDFFSRKFDKLD